MNDSPSYLTNFSYVFIYAPPAISIRDDIFERKMMLNIGLTGGIATGKSTVAGMLAAKGAYHIDFDLLAHELQLPETNVWHEIVASFGASILNPDKTINRDILGNIVFADPAKLDQLNNIVHPQVFAAWQDKAAAISAADPQAVIIADIPLLIESGLQDLFDIVMLVYIPPREQMNRLMKRNGYSHDEAEKRIASQMAIDEKIKYAHIVLRNDGTLAETKEKVDILWQELQAFDKNVLPPLQI
jgi:dephospho-CoA kinase